MYPPLYRVTPLHVQEKPYPMTPLSDETFDFSIEEEDAEGNPATAQLTAPGAEVTLVHLTTGQAVAGKASVVSHNASTAKIRVHGLAGGTFYELCVNLLRNDTRRTPMLLNFECH